MKADFRHLFWPSSVAVVGATEDQGKLGFHVMKSLRTGGFRGDIFPVNPGRRGVMGLAAHPSLEEIPQGVDLAILVVPSSSVLEQVKACARKGVKGIVLITAGFKEIDDPAGARLQEELAQEAARAGIPIIGPNTFGIVNLHHKLNASFTPEFSRVKPGGVTLVSQSGGMSHLLAFLAMRSGVGLSKVIGLGNRCNVDFQDLLEWLVMDPATDCVAMYVEGLEDARGLIHEAKRLKGRKPLLAYKCGRSELGDRASRSHTGSMAGAYEVYRGAFAQAGILWLESSDGLLDAAKALSRCPCPKGDRVAILSGQAGPAMAALDACIAKGLKVYSFDADTQGKVNQLLAPLAMRTNPVDMGPAWYDPEAIRGIVKAALESPSTDALLLLIMFASANVRALDGLEDILSKWAQKKPVLSCISAPPGLWEREVEELEEKGALVNYPTPERAASALWALCSWGRMAKESW
ncbi:MAG: acetate--CoA ligase family protein [Thermodesulfobacteriota bacterium]